MYRICTPHALPPELAHAGPVDRSQHHSNTWPLVIGRSGKGC